MWDYRFFEVSAQVLPVLYLAVVVEYGFLRQRLDDKDVHSPLRQAITAAAYLAVGVIFFAGEFQALDVVSRGDPAFELPDAVVAAYTLAALLLVAPLYVRLIRHGDLGYGYGDLLIFLIIFVAAVGAAFLYVILFGYLL